MKTPASSGQPTPISLPSPVEPAFVNSRARSRRHSYLPRIPRLDLVTLTCGLAGLMLTGCGSPGTPQPPSLKLPAPPTDLAVSRAGSLVSLRWTMPRRASDRVLLTGDQRVVICRSPGPVLPTAPCTQVGVVLLEAGKPAGYTDTLPAALLTGPLRPLVYTVVLQNRKQRSAGPSNQAYTAAGAAPPPITGLHAQATAAGIELQWQPDATAPQPGAQYLLRLQRTRLAAPGQSAGSMTGAVQAGVPQPLEQTLEVPAVPGGMAAFRDHALDRDAMLNHTYRYTVERVARLTLGGRSIEITGTRSEAATLEARDLFPPSVPQGLEAVADVEGGAIDLSWTADSDADLAGYYVYRRASNTFDGQVRVSGPALLANAAWRDEHAQPGVRYAYSVSAVDVSGNESARSREAEESVTPAPRDAQPVAPHR